MSSDTVRVALIGSGKMATVHARSISRCEEAELVVVAGGSGATHLAHRYGAATDDVANALQRSDIDAVVIASPNRFHAEQIVQAAAAGKAVLVEKPVDLRLDRVDQCITAVGSASDRVIVAFNRRFDPSFSAVRAGISRGEVGDVQQLVIFSRDAVPPPLDYVPGSGGLLLDMTIHDFDMARFLVGTIVAVSAQTQHADAGLTRAGDASGAIASLVAENGALVSIINARLNPSGYDQRLEVLGSKGFLSIGNPSTTLVTTSTATRTSARGPWVPHYADRYEAAYRAEIEHLIAVTRGTQRPLATLQDGRAALEVALAAEASVRERRVVTLG